MSAYSRASASVFAINPAFSLQAGQVDLRIPIPEKKIVAQMKTALDGDLNRVKRVIKLGGFVNCTDDFKEQPLVINAASDLMVGVFGDAGRHSRSAVGTNSLPLAWLLKLTPW